MILHFDFSKKEIDPDLIHEGDIVAVDINGSRSTITNRAKVIRVPLRGGGMWVVKDIESGEVHYIGERCTVTKLVDEESDV